MRIGLLAGLAFISFGLAVVSCGGGNNIGGNSDLRTAPVPDLAVAPPDFTEPPDQAVVPPDFSVPPMMGDLVYNPPRDANGISCGNQTCPNNKKCCVSYVNMMLSSTCMDSCPDAAYTVSCSGPGNCGGNPCCATVEQRMIKSVSCTTKPSDCSPMLSPFTQSGMDRLCTTDQDCTNAAPGNTMLIQCCTLMQGGAAVHVCLNSQFIGFLGGTCP